LYSDYLQYFLIVHSLDEDVAQVVVANEDGTQQVRTYKKRALRAGDKERTIRLAKYQSSERLKENKI
jgi:hypothetical protein